MTRRGALATAALLLVTGCGGAAPPRSGAQDGGIAGPVTVLAAASLADTFTALGRRFEARHPAARVRFGFAASSELAAQISGGAPADVFASASPATMTQVADAGLVAGEPAVFARNRLQIAVPAGNPGGVRGLADLARDELAVALCAPEVPCGSAAERLLAAGGVSASVDTYEADARATLTKVTLGEVDAALVYRTDVLAAGDGAVTGLDVPEAAQAVNDYPVAVLADAPNERAARAFVGLVRSAVGRRLLARAGFEIP